MTLKSPSGFTGVSGLNGLLRGFHKPLRDYLAEAKQNVSSHTPQNSARYFHHHIVNNLQFQTPASHLITPGQQQDLGVGVLSGRGHFDDDGLHHDRAVGEVLDGVTFQHAEAEKWNGKRGYNGRSQSSHRPRPLLDSVGTAPL